ncbi:MAG TPA: hypothetical protein VMG12_45815 [Polyangiaceae bacterium]|nr:hypothetical protein [Polyangiaceae bacterium]
MSIPRVRLASALACAGLYLTLACSPSVGGGQGQEPEWPAVAKKWFDRAGASFNALDIGDAEVSVKNALELEPNRPSVKLLAASIALSQMRYDEAVSLLQGETSADARGLRARAYWYSGQLARASEELDRLLEDPEVKDPWAQGVVQLARTGEGREPFRVTGALLAVVDMPRVPVPTLIVPLELNGEPVLAMVATGAPEVEIDSTQQKASWVSLRFGRRLEVKDVPALSRDLSGLSRRVGAPIKMLLGVNLLRRLNVTFDFYASQFVVRAFAPPPPPEATALELSYIKGGGMVTRARLGNEPSAPGAAFLVDTGVVFPLAMSDSGWQKAGVDPKGFESVSGEANLKQGVVPRFELGGFDLPRVPAVYGLPLGDLERGGGIHLDGVIGSALVAEFRASLVDQGRTLWLEEMPVASRGPSPDEVEGDVGQLVAPGTPGPNAPAPAAPRKPAAPGAKPAPAAAPPAPAAPPPGAAKPPAPAASAKEPAPAAGGARP